MAKVVETTAWGRGAASTGVGEVILPYPLLESWQGEGGTGG